MSLDTENSLLSLDDTLDYLGLGTTTGSTETNDKVTDIINSVSYRFNLETGRLLKSRSYTDVYDGNGKNNLMLNQYPLSSTTITINIDTNRAFTDTDKTVTSTDVFLSTETAIVELDDDIFGSGFKNVQVQYSAGYTTAQAYDLVDAAKEYSWFKWNRRTNKNAAIGVRSESFEGVTVTYETDLPWSVKQILDRYRNRREV